MSGTSTPLRGHFIVLEGLDRTGKSTQCDLLVRAIDDKVRGVHASCSATKSWKFPERTTALGQLIDRYLRKEIELGDSKGKAIHLLFSANRWECSQEIESLLASGISVVCDRYAFSGLAFSMAKGLEEEYLLTPDKGLPLPDLTLFLTLSEEESKLRGGFGEERYEQTSFQSLVAQQFRHVRDRFISQHGSDRWVDIDAQGSIEDVQDRIWKVVSRSLEKDGVRGELWV
ncbi:Thymidylate kinase/adenylate kinase [Phaffia rhodozyma]|uniref:Thymidylate kinase n=1 Tax=Phaffia rhodozyma TaxID=264483 RepID=A0A0F7SFT8_PHARH|nr:Thymidylate kinase/adenylate kinase [Phaffia rhodozyma]